MLSQVITQSPAVEEFTLLDQHQSQTPESFHHGKPVLHHLARGAKAITQRVKVHRLPFFPSPDTNGSGEQAATAGAGDVVAEVDVYITSTWVRFEW